MFQGRTYASKAERQYAELLWTCYRSGAISVLIEQPSLWLGVPENVYRPDFFVIQGGEPRFIDVKGVETPAFRKVKKLWQNYGQCALVIIKKKGTKFLTAERIEGVSRARS